MKPKTKITPGMLDSKGFVQVLEANGHNRETIHKAMYDITDGASTAERRDIMKNLYDRGYRK